MKIEELRELFKSRFPGIMDDCEIEKADSWQLCSSLMTASKQLISENHSRSEDPNLELTYVSEQIQRMEFVNQFALSPILPANFCPHSVLKKEKVTLNEDLGVVERNERIRQLLEYDRDIISSFKENTRNSSGFLNIYIEFLAGILTLEVKSNIESLNSFVKEQSDWLIRTCLKANYVKSLIILKSFPNVPTEFSILIHKKLMDCLKTSGGLEALCDNIVFSGSAEKQMWEKCEIVSKIITSKVHGKDFHLNIINQLFELYQKSIITNENNRDYSEVCITCFNSFLNLNSKLSTETIESFFIGKLIKLANPEDLLSGLVVLDKTEIEEIINLNYSVFRASKASSLKSSILIPVVPIFYRLWVMADDSFPSKRLIYEIIIQCLANREENELKLIIESILFKTENQFQLNDRIRWNSDFNLVIVSEEEAKSVKYDWHLYLADFLKKSNNNILIFNIFLIILNLFEEVMDNKLGNMDLVTSEEDFEEVVCSVYQKHFSILPVMTELLTYRPFHFQFSENPLRILDFLKRLLLKKTVTYNSSDDQILYHILSIFKEIVVDQKERYVDEIKQIKLLMIELQKKVKKESILSLQLSSFLETVESGNEFKESISKLNQAKQLCSFKEPYLRVYGMKEMMKLLKSKDKETLANLDHILLLALDCIKDEDSYSFLTSIQLLVALTNYLENTVLETLIAEFQDENFELDYRLKIGETVVKVVEGLGPLAVKYKDLTITCFLRGIINKNSSNEFRVSCIYNMGIICKILTYQIHNFFNELMDTLKMVLETDSYLPSRRAAALLLKNIIDGMENLMDFQEFLMPIYRLLKQICENDHDEKTRVHAGNGLKSLGQKIKESLTPKTEDMVKEIKILGVKPQSKPKTIFHI